MDSETDRQNAIATLAAQAWLGIADATAIHAVIEVFKDRAKLRAELQQVRASWRCFHCGEVFNDEGNARAHFGNTECGKPLCEYTLEQIHGLENQLSRYREDDGPIHQKMASMEVEHAQALRRAEEEGYSKGLKDYTAIEVQLQKAREALEKAGINL